MSSAQGFIEDIRQRLLPALGSAATGRRSQYFFGQRHVVSRADREHPYATRLQSALITSTALSYGVASGPNCGIPGVNGYAWRADTLIRVSQVGNTITIFTLSDSGSDISTPVDEITYTLTQ